MNIGTCLKNVPVACWVAGVAVATAPFSLPVAGFISVAALTTHLFSRTVELAREDVTPLVANESTAQPQEETVLADQQNEPTPLVADTPAVPLHIAQWLKEKNLDKSESSGPFSPCSLLLHVAVRDGRADIMRWLLDAGCQVDIRAGIYNQTPLHCAAYHRQLEVAQLLLDRGACVNAVNKCGQTPLHKAADNYDAKMVELFLHNGAELNTADEYGKTPLHYAARNREVQIVELLLHNGAELNVADNRGRTPLALLQASLNHGVPQPPNRVVLRRGA